MFYYLNQELIYHTIAAILLLIASVFLLVKLQDYKRHDFYNAYTVAGVKFLKKKQNADKLIIILKIVSFL